MGLFIGKKFKIITKNSVSHAEIIGIEDKYVNVLIDGKKFKMEKAKLERKFSDYENEKEYKASRSCKNCMEYKNGNCTGGPDICDEYRPSPDISKEEKDRWPKNGFASAKKSDKYINREYSEPFY